MVYDRSIRIGCAISQYKESQFGKPQQPWLTTVLVCNYVAQQVHNFPIYKTGVTGSSCRTGKNPNYPNLCNEKEKISLSPSLNDYHMSGRNIVDKLLSRLL